MGDDTIPYEDTSSTDPETLAEPVEVLMIENTTDTEEPVTETIITAMVVPVEEDIPETDAEKIPVEIFTQETETEIVPPAEYNIPEPVAETVPL